MPAKSQVKKRQIAGRAIFRSRGLNSYYGTASWTRTHSRARRRERNSVLSGSGYLSITVIFVFVTVAVSLWFGWRIQAGLNDLAKKEVRFQALNAENRGLGLRLEKLSTRTRIEKLAAERGLYPPRSRQLIRMR